MPLCATPASTTPKKEKEIKSCNIQRYMLATEIKLLFCENQTPHQKSWHFTINKIRGSILYGRAIFQMQQKPNRNQMEIRVSIQNKSRTQLIRICAARTFTAAGVFRAGSPLQAAMGSERHWLPPLCGLARSVVV